jgi:hypothetical protein
MENNTNLSPKAKENLQRNAKSRQKDNPFVKLQNGETIILELDAEKIDIVEVDYSGEKILRYRYTVKDPNNGSHEKFFDVGKRTSEVIDAYLSEGHNVLKIQRFGLGMDTRYHVTPD